MHALKQRGVNGLRSLEKYTKTDMVYLAKGGFWLGLGQFISSASAFLASVAFANLLAPDAYGIYKFVLSINSLILITTLTGMDSSVTQSISRGFEGTLLVGVKEKMKWGVIGSGISLSIAAYYLLNGNNPLAISFAILAIFVPFTESTDLYNSLLWGKKLFNIQAKYNAINTLLILAASTITLFLTKNIYLVLLAYLLALSIPNIIFLRNVLGKYKTNDEIDPDAIRFGKHLSLINIVSMIVTQLDKILVFHYVGAANLAVYALAVAPTDQVKGLLKNLNSLAMPKFSEKTSEEIKRNLWYKIWTLGIIMLVIVFAYIMLVPILFKIFFPKYLSSILYSQVLSLSLLPVVLAGFLYTILESQKATRELYQHNVYTNIFSILILFPLVYYFGIWGAISSRIINRIFVFIVSAILIKKLR